MRCQRVDGSFLLHAGTRAVVRTGKGRASSIHIASQRGRRRSETQHQPVPVQCQCSASAKATVCALCRRR